MLVPLAFSILMLFFMSSGVVMAANPRKWMAASNRITRWAWGSEYWFRYTPERLTRWDVLRWRISGGLMATISGIAFARVVYGLWVSPMGSVGQAAHVEPERSSSTGMAFWYAFLAFWTVYGLLLVVKPRHALKLFGTWRSLHVSDDSLWVCRVIGVAVACACIFTIISFATTVPAG